MQTKKDSLLEAISNILVGYTNRLLIIIFILPILGVHIEFAVNMIVAGIFTAESFFRSYSIRRRFTSRSHKQQLDMKEDVFDE